MIYQLAFWCHVRDFWICTIHFHNPWNSSQTSLGTTFPLTHTWPNQQKQSGQYQHQTSPGRNIRPFQPSKTVQESQLREIRLPEDLHDVLYDRTSTQSSVSTWAPPSEIQIQQKQGENGNHLQGHHNRYPASITHTGFLWDVRLLTPTSNDNSLLECQRGPAKTFT